MYVRTPPVGDSSDAGDNGAGSAPSGRGATSSAVFSFSGCLSGSSTRHAISVWMTLALPFSPSATAPGGIYGGCEMGIADMPATVAMAATALPLWGLSCGLVLVRNDRGE